VEHAPAGVAMFDMEMRYLVASRRWMNDYGLSEPLIGRCHYELFPELPERWKDVHRRVLAGEYFSAEDDRFERPDGTVQYVRWEALPWRTAKGGIGGLLIAAEEITARKLADEGLRESEERQHLALSAGKLATWDWDMSCGKMTWNDAQFEALATKSARSSRASTPGLRAFILMIAKKPWNCSCMRWKSGVNIKPTIVFSGRTGRSAGQTVVVSSITTSKGGLNVRLASRWISPIASAPKPP